VVRDISSRPIPEKYLQWYKVNEEKPDFLTQLNRVEDPLATLPQERVQPSAEDLKKIMAELK
jgi:hypothetical protein